MLERLNDAFDKRLQVRGFDWRFLDRTAIACEYVVKRLHVLCVLVTLQDRAGQVLVLQEHVEVAGLLGCPIARGIAREGDTQIRRVPMWMKTRKYKSTIPLIVHFRLQAKSHCHMVSACRLRNSDQVSGVSCG